jgi:hypothetical protein
MQIALDDEPPESRELRVVMATTAQKLFLGLRPFWGREPGAVRLTMLAADARNLTRAAWGILRGHPPAWATPELGYASHNCERAAFRLDCGVTVDGELFAPCPGRSLELTGDRRVRFVRA